MCVQELEAVIYSDRPRFKFGKQRVIIPWEPGREDVITWDIKQ